MIKKIKPIKLTEQQDAARTSRVNGLILTLGIFAFLIYIASIVNLWKYFGL